MQSLSQKLTNEDRVVMPFTHLPNFRTMIALQNGVAHNILFRTWGGIGDQICAEPTLRFAMKAFRDCSISLVSEMPELFSHLKFDRVYDLRKETPDYDQYLLYDTITSPDESNLVWQFFSHLHTNCVDFPSLCALRSQLPVADREVRLEGAPGAPPLPERAVIVHAGRHWQSKTFPKDFWDDVLGHLTVDLDVTPVLIGGDADDNRGTVDVNASGCIDLRGKLSIKQTISLLKKSKVLLTNDSAPLHMAVDSTAWIGYIATCKHPDMITHFRRGQWGWRMVNHGNGGIWDNVSYATNTDQKIEVEKVDPELLRSWLPDPREYARWAAERAD